MADRTRDLELVAAALSIGERVAVRSRGSHADEAAPEARADTGAGTSSGESGLDVHARVEAWARRVNADGDPGRFDQRLAWLGLDRAGASRVASTPVLGESFDAPPWLEVQRQVDASFVAEPEPASVDVAFGQYWHGWGRVGRARLEARLAELGVTLPVPVLEELERGLVRELAALGARPLMDAFDEHRLPWQLGPGYAVARLSATAPTELYRSFVEQLRSTPLLRTRFPALARLCATRLAYWVDALSELVVRLEADRGALGALVGRELGQVVALGDRVSDSHDGGRRVIMLDFEQGLRVVYKPRGVGSERAFGELLAWANERLPDGPKLEPHWVLDRETYGWTEHVAPMPCPEQEARDYYERAGMLLALAHALVGSDCHEENVIAHGSCPVLVDLETFAGPRLFPRDEAAPEYAEAIELLESESVLSIGMLPGWTFSRFGLADVSAFGGDGKTWFYRFEKLNTDLMRLVRSEETVSRSSANQPRLASGEAIEAERHVEVIVAGFERMYALVRARVDELMRPEGPLALLQKGRARVVFRDTSQYSEILGASLRPGAMVDGFARSVVLEALATDLVDLSPAPEWAPALLSLEQDALLRGDIPLFLAGRSDGGLFARDPNLGTEVRLGTMHSDGTGARRLGARLRQLGSEDLALQRRCIESSFVGRAIREEAALAGREAPGVAAEPELERVALGMARAIRESSIAGPRGGRFWLGLEPDASDRTTSRVGVLGPWLYSGQVGVALALSAAFARSRDAAFAGAARAALAPVRELLLSGAASASMGAFDGLAGVVYAFWHSAELLGEPTLVDDARALLRLIDEKSIDGDRAFDVTSGAAGLILALRSLEPVDAELTRELVTAAARHLVEHARSVEGGVGWPNWLEPRPLCGMAHGNSGIAWALMEAFRVTGDRGFRDVAFAATDYERARRAETPDGAWPDLRKQPTRVAGWCHGPPGIALARSGMLRIEDRAELREDLELARTLMCERSSSEPRAHLCCGQTGIDDVLLELGLRSGDAAATSLARSRASERIRSLGENPDRWMHPRAREGVATIPGMMKGWSGIVWTLLRLTSRDQPLPCVLGLEP